MFLRLSKSIFPLEKQMTTVTAPNKTKSMTSWVFETCVGVGGGRQSARAGAGFGNHCITLETQSGSQCPSVCGLTHVRGCGEDSGPSGSWKAVQCPGPRGRRMAATRVSANVRCKGPNSECFRLCGALHLSPGTRRSSRRCSSSGREE